MIEISPFDAICTSIFNFFLLRMSDTGVRYIVEGASGDKLRELNLTNCIRVSDVSLLRISQKYVLFVRSKLTSIFCILL